MRLLVAQVSGNVSFGGFASTDPTRSTVDLRPWIPSEHRLPRGPLPNQRLPVNYYSRLHEQQLPLRYRQDLQSSTPFPVLFRLYQHQNPRGDATATPPRRVRLPGIASLIDRNRLHDRTVASRTASNPPPLLSGLHLAVSTAAQPFETANCRTTYTHDVLKTASVGMKRPRQEERSTGNKKPRSASLVSADGFSSDTSQGHAARASMTTSTPAGKQSRYLREMDRRNILERLAHGEKQADLAKEFSVSRAAICNLNKHRDAVLSRQNEHPLAKHPKRRGYKKVKTVAAQALPRLGAE